MGYGLLISVLTGALVSAASGQSHQYYFVNTTLNWTEAQSFCRQNYADLATIENTAEVSAVNSLSSNSTGKAWIGLYDDLENSWRWSLTDSSFYGEGETEFRNWRTGRPNNLNGQQYCVILESSNSGIWEDDECSDTHPFVCYNGTINNNSSFVKVITSMNWTEAQSFCRENYVDLVSIRNQTENDIITNLLGGDFALWIGLYREKVWSDGSTSLFRHWANGQPNSGTENCVATSFLDLGQWSDENCGLSLPFICYKTINFRLVTQNETSITLKWNKDAGIGDFILQINGVEHNISGLNVSTPVQLTVRVISLTAGTQYTFTLFSVFENIRSSGVSITAVTAPLNAGSFRSTGQDETSITLQWNKVNNNVSFILQFDGTETNITASDGDGPVTHTVSSLTAGTQYTFTLFSVFENIRSSGVGITAVTAPLNAGSFRSTGQDETSITLQWNKVNNNVSFILQFDGTETNITAPDGDGPVTHTVSSLTAGTQYTFTLFSVFENIRSSGVNITAVTATQPQYVVGLNINLKSYSHLSDSEMQSMLEELFRRYGLSPQSFSLKVKSVKP